MNKTRKYILVTMLAALAVVLNVVENLMIPPLAFGIRFGIANIISLLAIKLFGKKELLFIVVLRIVIANLIKGTIFGTSFWISTSGVIISTIIIIILDSIKASLLFTSMMSALGHSFGQLMAVIILYNQINIFSLFPMLIIVSIATGVLTGLLSNYAIKRIKTNQITNIGA